MPIDTTALPALERELEYAKHVRSGGQPPDPGRVKAIEDQIRITRAALAGSGASPVETTQAKPVEVELADAPTPEKTVVPTVAKEKAA